MMKEFLMVDRSLLNRPLAHPRRLPSIRYFAAMALLALSVPVAHAQVVYGSMVGSVVDATNASVPNATVRITLTSTSDVRTAPTDSAGSYTIASVTPGTYTVEITRDGFRSFVAKDVLVNQNNVVRVDATLQVGSTSERVEVTATSAGLQTDRADVHGELTTKQL
ncbi:MAG: carboxypeptidase regulatory-like domain-containing protein, partial [Acidobacteriia bacterium]|nr:carboxypeptidase regulatory-like domain-containing protein [Terriglobia bacterium]